MVRGEAAEQMDVYPEPPAETDGSRDRGEAVPDRRC